MLQDPVADMLTRIRNAQASMKATVSFSSSKFKKAILNVLKEEGFIESYAIKKSSDAHELIEVQLKYHVGNPVIDGIDRISKSSRRVYKTVENLPSVMSGLGVAIVSTSKGVMTEKKARSLNVGGEIVCFVR